MTRLLDAMQRADGSHRPTGGGLYADVSAPPWQLAPSGDLAAETPLEASTLPVPAVSTERALVVATSAPRHRARGLITAAIFLAVAALVVGGYAFFPSAPVRLAGIVSANEVVVSSTAGGRLAELKVDESDAVVPGMLVAVMDQRELAAARSHEQGLIDQLTARLRQTHDIVSATERRTTGDVSRAEAELEAARGDRAEAASDLDQKRADAARGDELGAGGIIARQQAEQLHSAASAAASRVQALDDRVRAAEARLALARAASLDVVVASSDVAQTAAQIRQAQAALAEAEARLKDTEILAPIGGTVSLRVARQGEIVRAGDPIVVLIDPDDVWVRVEVDESRASAIAVGQRVPVELPSGERLEGRVIQIAAEGDFATQRDASRWTRDIRTIGFKVSVPNRSRRLHPGMTAYVLLPAQPAAR
jgi:multidrug resistance efflux pump